MRSSNVYFISDLHLGAAYIADPLEHERKVVRWLKSIEDDVSELYMLGDILDYWYEYKEVVPRGFTRFFGQIASMADAGVKITWFIGNHDIWIFDYLPRELGITVIDGSLVREINGKRFFMAHGDALGDLPRGFRLIRSIFRNKFCQRLYAAIHPRWTVPFAHRWSRHSRANEAGEYNFDASASEPLVKFAVDYQRNHVDHPVDFFVLGHRHVMVDYGLPERGRLVILGDWINHFSYGRWDGKIFTLECIDDKMNVKMPNLT